MTALTALDLFPFPSRFGGWDVFSDTFDSRRDDVPYDIRRTGDTTSRLTLAVAGFKQDELSIEAKRNVLSVAGNRAEETDEKPEGDAYVYRGIVAQDFERRFRLGDHVRVSGAKVENGLLHIDLAQEVPEAEKAQKIAITNPDANG